MGLLPVFLEPYISQEVSFAPLASECSVMVKGYPVVKGEVER